ncbi:MAG: hypothetical protein LH473_07920 [Chitinophagales bacterium]|nr:hypothetical protein [Chitinophagales bacterium]
MKILLDIKDNKVDFMMELFNNLPFVKAKRVNEKKEQFLKELEEAVEQDKLHKQGKIKLKSLQEVLDEL